jgi:catechol 2,3-dioxygenase-like lactoylglutathione lyase family enzyme
MTAPPIDSFRPFVPAKDLQVSLRFYRHLGFEVAREFSDGSGAIIALGASSLILTSFYDKAYAENFMMQLVVPDLDRWWEHIQAARLHEAFDVPAPKPPTMQPWGLMVSYVVDPTGVLWHVVPSHG